MLEGLSPVHLIIVLAVAVLILGPGKLPEAGAALGQAVRGFRRGMSDDRPPDQPATPGDSTPES